MQLLPVDLSIKTGCSSAWGAANGSCHQDTQGPQPVQKLGLVVVTCTKVTRLVGDINHGSEIWVHYGIHHGDIEWNLMGSLWANFSG